MHIPPDEAVALFLVSIVFLIGSLFIAWLSWRQGALTVVLVAIVPITATILGAVTGAALIIKHGPLTAAESVDADDDKR